MPDERLGSALRVTKFLTSLSSRDLFLIGFVSLFVLTFGVLTGYIPSPLLTLAHQHEQILKNGEEEHKRDDKLVELAKLQLYLQRENCFHGADSDAERSRCDRQSIRDAILDEIPATSYFSSDAR